MRPSSQFSGPLHEKSYRFALQSVFFCKNIADKRKEFILTKQLMRSATSVGANIEEAQQPQSRPDFISKLSIALKEAYESRYWLYLMIDTHYADDIITQPLIVEAEALIKMLVRSIRTTKDSIHR
jgi:four helix bundle protein